MWKQLIVWLSKTAPEEPSEQRIERLLRGLRSPERVEQQRAENVIGRIFADPVGYEEEFLVALISALAHEGDLGRLDIVPRYLLLLTSGSVVSRSSRVKEAAQTCLDRWYALQEERAQAETLLRASERQGGAEFLLRPATDNTSVIPEEHLRPSQQEPDDRSQLQHGESSE